MSIYYEAGAGDFDAQQLLAIRREARHDLPCNETSQPAAMFERHTRGFGGRILTRQGWLPGQKLGSRGLVEPLDCSDQRRPGNTAGLGYYGERRTSRSATLESNFQKVCDASDTLLRRGDPRLRLKWRLNESMCQSDSVLEPASVTVQEPLVTGRGSWLTRDQSLRLLAYRRKPIAFCHGGLLADTTDGST